MPRRRKYYDEQNLTALRALPLLMQTTRARGTDLIADMRSALRECQEALEKHVRFSLRRSKANR